MQQSATNERRKTSNFASYHPVNNFIYFLFVIVASMFTLHPLFLFSSTIASLCYVTSLKGANGLKQSLRLMLFIVALTTIGNFLLSHNGVTVFFYVNNNAMTLEALIYGGVMGIMIATVIVWFSCAQVIIGEEKFIYLFGRISPAVALTISMMFRFIPLLKYRYKMIHQAQMAMGRNKEAGMIKRIRQGAKEISILVSWSLENAIDTADSMEARGYGLKRRSSFHLYLWEMRDGIIASLIMVLGIISWIGVFSDVSEFYYYPKILFNVANIKLILIYIGYAMLLVTPIVIDWRGERRWKQLESRM